jgi:multidrug resistance protein MdtO
MPVYPKENQLSSIIWPELSPSPGRFAGSLRDMIGVVLAVVLCMTLRVPGIALALALLFLLQREHPGVTLRSGIQIVSSAAAACAATFLWVQFTDGTDLARFLGFIIVIFTAAFGTAATRFPLFWSIFGFYGSLDVAAWDAHRTSNAIVTSSLYNLASLSLVVLCAVVVDYAFATRNPDEVLQQEMRKRLVCLASFFHKLADAQSTSRNEALRTVHHELIRYANAGDVYLNELYDQIHDEDQKLARVPLGIHYRIGLLARVLEKSALLGFSTSTGSARQDHRDAYQMIAALCDSLLTSDATVPTQTTTTPMSFSLWEIFLELQQYREVQLPVHGASIRRSSERRNPPANSVFLPGVFESSDVTLHALKLTFAATICYIIYNAVAWPGIFTCVVTVLFTGLSSTGAMKQKQLYRILGAAMGGALGIATVSFLYPNTDSITALTLIVAPVALLSGWVLRSPRISYVGVQIGFAFFLTVLPGFSATTSLAPARDRIAGIALGILVMWFIFDQLWPTRTSDALKTVLFRIQSARDRLRGLDEQTAPRIDERTFDQMRTMVSSELAHMQQLDFSVYFEIGWHRKREIVQSRRLIKQIEASAAEFYALALQREVL